jgi:hypothetical protein
MILVYSTRRKGKENRIKVCGCREREERGKKKKGKSPQRSHSLPFETAGGVSGGHMSFESKCHETTETNRFMSQKKKSQH